jgi:hypothetical protein
MRHIFMSGIFGLAAICPAMAVEQAAAAKEAGSPAKPAAAESVLPAEPVFDCYHVNSAWGYVLAGKFVDAQGNIWSYGKRGQAWLPALVKEQDQVYLKETELREKYTEVKPAGSVDAKVLADKSVAIAAAAAGAVTRADTGTRDAGSSSCHAYIHDAPHARYRDVELGSDRGISDVRITNSAPEAQELLVWLASLGVAK